MARVILEPRAVKEYRKLSREVARRIKTALSDLQKDFPSPILDIKKLQPPLVGYRLRVGDYRILFDREADFFLVYSIKHRKDAYK